MIGGAFTSGGVVATIRFDETTRRWRYEVSHRRRGDVLPLIGYHRAGYARWHWLAALLVRRYLKEARDGR